jgi:hypothetical protein
MRQRRAFARVLSLGSLPVAAVSVAAAYALGRGEPPPLNLSHVTNHLGARAALLLGLVLYGALWFAQTLLDRPGRWAELALVAATVAALSLMLQLPNAVFPWLHDVVGAIGVALAFAQMVARVAGSGGRAYTLCTCAVLGFAAALPVMGVLYLADQNENGAWFAAGELAAWSMHALYVTAGPWRTARLL